MAQSSMTSELKLIETSSVSWLLKNWSQYHELLAQGNASCIMAFDDECVKIRFFLQPIVKAVVNGRGTNTYYSLCAEVIQSKVNRIVVFQADVPVQTDAVHSDCITKDGQLYLNRIRKGSPVIVITDFLKTIDDSVSKSVNNLYNIHLLESLFQMPELKINLKGTLFQLTSGDSDNKYEPTDTSNKPAEPEISMLTQFKNMYAEENNFSDLKLETKDNITLKAHKFQLCARSPVFKTMIKAEVKRNGFDGIIKIADVNAKALVVILHWIYTGELHENLGEVIDAVLQAAVKYQLADLLKTLETKVIEIAKRMPDAAEDVCGFIKENFK